MDESQSSCALFRRARRLPSQALSILLAASLAFPAIAPHAMAQEHPPGQDSPAATVGSSETAGQIQIYSAYLEKSGGSATYVFSEDDVAVARAKESRTLSPIPSESLTYQWMEGPDGGEFKDIPGATSESLSLAGLAGKCVKCKIAAKVGDSSYTTRASKPIAPSGSVNVTSVVLDKSGTVSVGDRIVAKATAESGDVTSNEKVSWAWYSGDSKNATDERIEGAEGNELDVTDALLGKYVQARADGGYGESKSSAIGPVAVPGAVELYQVSVSGDARVGSVLTAEATKGNSYTPVADADAVSYQWQYAERQTTADSAFSDIEGETSKTYEVQPSMEGKFLRVKATSLNTLVSTKKPYYGTTQPVDPAGPVMLKGQYHLSSVALSSSGQGMQAGNVITPKAKVESGYYESDIPEDAQVSYAWEVSESEAGPFSKLPEGVDQSSGSLTLGEGLVGKYVKVSANALDNTVSSAAYRVVESGAFELLRVTASPQISSGMTKLFTGDEVKTFVAAKNLTSVSYGDDVTASVSVKWYVSNTASGSFEPLPGASSATLSIPKEAAGKYLKVVATSGSSSVELVSANAVVDANSLEGISERLVQDDWRPDFSGGQDVNANDLLRAKLSEMGVENVAVSVDSVEFSNEKEGAQGGISTASDSTNGNVEGFFVDPGTVSWANYDSWRQVKPVYRLERDGQSVFFEPRRASTLPWDEQRAKALLEGASSDLAIQYAEGDQSLSVTKDLVLPYKIAGKSWTSVTWKSSSSAVVVSGYSWEDYTGRVARSSEDQNVVLTAEVSMATSGGFESTCTVTFPVVVKGNSQLADEERKDLASKVAAAFVPEKISELSTGSEVDLGAVAVDLALPTPRAIGVDGKYYEVTYRASNDAIAVNGYAGKVYRGLPESQAKSVELTCTVAKKSDPSVSASKTLSTVVVPLTGTEIESEQKLMNEAKARLFEGMANGQEQSSVNGDLRSFQKAYRAKDGTLAWSYDRATSDSQAGGVIADDIDLSHPSEQWNLFKSSRPDLIAHETLRLLKRPDYDTKVDIEVCLSSKMFARYVERYADDEKWGKAFAGLSRQKAVVEVTVAGLKGGSNPDTSVEEGVQVSFSLSGQGMGFSDVVKLSEGASVYDAFSKALSTHGYSWKGSTYVSSVTSPAGVTLSAGQFGPNSGWMYQVNGVYPDTYANAYYLKGGERVSWVYVGASSSGEGSQENPDGSTTTVEVRPDGATVEQTVWPDGSSVVSTVRPDGVSATVSKDAEGKVTAVEAKVPEGSARGIVSLPVEGLDVSGDSAGSVAVKLDAPAGTRVSVPAANVGAGTVAVVVTPGEADRVLRDSAVSEGSVVFEVDGPCAVRFKNAAAAFHDVVDGVWYADSVRFSSSRMLMVGIGGLEGVFAPDSLMNRAMFVTVLNRLSYDAPALSVPPFADVEGKAWYGNTVAWASESGIVSGYDDSNRFGPEDVVTREQMAVFLMRYASVRGMDVSARAENYDALPGAGEASEWAREAMSWAVATGLLKGDEGSGALRPGAGTSRAEAAAVTMRFVGAVSQRF